MKSLSKTLLGLALSIILSLGAGLAYADGAEVRGSNNTNLGGMSNLYRHADGIGMTADVTGLRGGNELKKGHPYTVWAVIFNRPSECAGNMNGDPCTPDDFGPLTDTRVTQISLNYSDDDGYAYFSGFVPEMPESGALVDAETAEVHFVYRRHPDKKPQYVSLNMFGGHCKVKHGEIVDGPKKNQCEDEGFSIHQP